MKLNIIQQSLAKVASHVPLHLLVLFSNRPKLGMTRGGWQVRERKARQAAKAYRISAPLSITVPPKKAIKKLSTSCPDIVPLPNTTSASESAPLAHSADSSTQPLKSSVPLALIVAATTSPARPSTPVSSLASNSLNGTFIDVISPAAIAAPATALSTTTSALENSASIQRSQITRTDTPFNTIISTYSYSSFLHDPALGTKLNERAKSKIAETAALESIPTGELSEESRNASLAQFNSKEPPNSEKLEQATATAQQLGAEMRRLCLIFLEAGDYESEEKWGDPRQEAEAEVEVEAEAEAEEAEAEDKVLESIAKITAFWQALQIDTKVHVHVQNYSELQSGQDQQERVLQEAAIQAEMRIADSQLHAAQAHEDLFSFMTHKLAKNEEASKEASQTAARIIALLIFSNCAFLGLLIAPYL